MTPVFEDDGGKGTPPVWKWYIGLCLFIALGNAGLAALGFWFISRTEEIAQASNYSPEMVKWEGDFFVWCGIVFAVGNVILPFLPNRPWTYVLHLTNIIAAGLSCCLLPVAIPVFIFWLRPEARGMFDFK